MTATHPTWTATRPHLRTVLDDLVDDRILGVSLHVHDTSGEWAASAGRAALDGTAAPSVDTRTRIGSNTKTFTAALVLLLVHEGRLGLDDPAAPHLPGLDLDPRVTVRMLLQHTSGVFNFTGDADADGAFEQGMPSNYGPAAREWLAARFETHRPEDLARFALARTARFEPGTRWSYSNTNYVLLRLIVENVTGRTLGEEMRRLVIDPLGLSGTSVPDASPDLPEPYARAYFRYEEDGQEQTVDVSRHNPSWISTGGDMISTPHDAATFFSALLGGRLLPADLVAQMCDPFPTPIPDMGYGLGVFVQELADGRTLVTHNGGMAGYATLMYGTPDGSTTMSAALNCVDDAEMSVQGAFQKVQQVLVDAVFQGEAIAP
ncbi:serine hydrolase domain-containing protein [Isoptericola sp. NPDC060257]|uniref:serine hydrolase domain-containing protein n=1 Tax=Isoptericola sp. NPDC060257 TaxID=3347087 RepID=UPI00365B16BA